MIFHLINDENRAEPHTSRRVFYRNSYSKITCMARGSSGFSTSFLVLYNSWNILFVSNIYPHSTPPKIKSLVFLWGIYPSALPSHVFQVGFTSHHYLQLESLIGLSQSSSLGDWLKDEHLTRSELITYRKHFRERGSVSGNK